MNKAKRKPHKIKPKTSIFKRRTFWLVVLVFVLSATIFYFAVFFSGFQTKNIIISGNEKVATSDIEALVSEKIKKQILFLNSESIFLISPTIISNTIMDSFPDINSVEVHRRLANTLVVNIKERVPLIIFCGSISTSEKCFFIDETGVAFEEATAIFSDFPVVFISPKLASEGGRQEIVLGKGAVKRDIVGFIIKIKKNLKDNFGVGIKEANIVSDERMNVLTSEGWNVYFNLTSDVDLQIAKLKLLLEKEIPQESRGALDYIDLRFGRAYICDKKSPCSK